jgi:hypothetical protein
MYSVVTLKYVYPAGSGFGAEEKPLRANKRLSIEHAQRSYGGTYIINLSGIVLFYLLSVSFNRTTFYSTCSSQFICIGFNIVIVSTKIF